MQDADFRARQVLADLGRVAALHSVPEPWGTALAADTPLDHRAAAAATLLQLILATRTPDPVLEDLWSHRQEFLAQPAQVRAALMNGFDHLRQRGLAPDPCRPAPPDCLTHRRPDLEPALIALARQMTPAEQDHIARADYGCDEARHHAALLALLADPQLAYPPGEVWYPAEVVELISHVPDEPGHVPCLAIVLLDALRTGDDRGNADYRLGTQFGDILALPQPARAVLIAAFRHLYESDRTWKPSVPEAGLPMDQTTLPWVDLP
jgi:hypothetical protein